MTIFAIVILIKNVLFLVIASEYKEAKQSKKLSFSKLKIYIEY